MQSAHDAYADLVRNHLGPALRVIGFRGARGAYTLPDADYWIRIGLQRSVWNDARRVDFTLNLTAIHKARWERLRRSQPDLPFEPAANTSYGAPAVGGALDLWQRRLGHLLPPKTDMWWTVGPDSDLSAVAAEVMDALRDHALPAIARETGIPGS